MKSNLFGVLFFWSGLVVVVHGQHIHEDHPTTNHGGGYYRAKLDGPGHSTPVVKLDSSGNYMIFNEWLINSTCGEIERGNLYSRSVTHQSSCGSRRRDGMGWRGWGQGVAVELKAYSKARVQLNGGWTGEWVEQLSFSSKTTLQKCQKIWYVFLKNRRKASGHVETWEHKMTCVKPATLHIAYTYCEKRKLWGTGIGWGTHIGEHVQRGLVNNCPCTNVDPGHRARF